MSPRTSKQFEEIREIRKKQIMDVAMYLFAEKGYSNTSISLIATKAKISKGLLYNYFTSKEDLLIHIFEEGIQEMLSFFDPNKDGVLTRDEFIFFIHETFNLMSRKISFYKLYFSLVMQPSVWSVFEKKFAEIITPLIKMLTAYYKNKGSKNPEAEAVLMGSLLDGIGFNYVFNPSLYPIEQVKEMVIKRFV
ncbi:MAG: TetR/AcrR family transcriptional regulator [Bacteroidales bacterium]